MKNLKNQNGKSNMKKAFIGIAFASQLLLANEKICIPEISLTNLDDTFGLSSMKVLQTEVDVGGTREIILPSSPDEIKATSSLSEKKTWATSKGCQILYLGSMTRLGETVQVSSKILNAQSGEVLFKRVHKAEDPDDLSPILSQIAGTMNTAGFESQESIYDISNQQAKAL